MVKVEGIEPYPNITAQIRKRLGPIEEKACKEKSEWEGSRECGTRLTGRR